MRKRLTSTTAELVVEQAATKRLSKQIETLTAFQTHAEAEITALKEKMASSAETHNGKLQDEISLLHAEVRRKDFDNCALRIALATSKSETTTMQMRMDAQVQALEELHSQVATLAEMPYSDEVRENQKQAYDNMVAYARSQRQEALGYQQRLLIATSKQDELRSLLDVGSLHLEGVNEQLRITMQALEASRTASAETFAAALTAFREKGAELLAQCVQAYQLQTENQCLQLMGNIEGEAHRVSQQQYAALKQHQGDMAVQWQQMIENIARQCADKELQICASQRQVLTAQLQIADLKSDKGLSEVRAQSLESAVEHYNARMKEQAETLWQRTKDLGQEAIMCHAKLLLADQDRGELEAKLKTAETLGQMVCEDLKNEVQGRHTYQQQAEATMNKLTSELSARIRASRDESQALRQQLNETCLQLGMAEVHTSVLNGQLSDMQQSYLESEEKVRLISNQVLSVEYERERAATLAAKYASFSETSRNRLLLLESEYLQQTRQVAALTASSESAAAAASQVWAENQHLKEYVGTLSNMLAQQANPLYMGARCQILCIAQRVREIWNQVPSDKHHILVALACKLMRWVVETSNVADENHLLYNEIKAIMAPYDAQGGNTVDQAWCSPIEQGELEDPVVPYLIKDAPTDPASREASPAPYVGN
ncbi:kinetoplast-associated protein-like protein [Strigomonas culicis]|uniref:Kinetoplast-associated protein-like protein n=1 Tax=Strigomonas culicis TaxID=28005 RepID=S9TAZ7_9TRYP|nr:kinetoplast-associated protein-like protein [Strigomonas culicis]|eukprot:EPY15152.1 kinetoplast-associated protein-like protein [Strigomonas culicis]